MVVVASGGFRVGAGGAAAPPLASFRKIQGLPISKIVRTADSTIIIITDFHLAASSHKIFLRVRGREGMKGLGALQRHQLPHPVAKILDPPLVVASKPQPRDSDWNRDLSTFGDSIWTVKMRLERSRFDLEKKDLNRDKSAACWPTQSAMHESSQRFGLGSSLMSLLRRTFGENFTECWPIFKFFHFRYIWRHAYVALITVFLLNHF